jgi:DNA-binding HxlR family transcriptional regulator
MKRKCLENAECPVARSLDAIGDWWSLLILRDAFRGVRRFGEFQRSLGVARNILTARLRKLVAVGILEVVPASDGSKYKEYALAEKARGLFLVLVALRQWGEDRLFGQEKPDWSLVDRQRGDPVTLELRATDGRRLTEEEVRIVAAGEP